MSIDEPRDVEPTGEDVVHRPMTPLGPVVGRLLDVVRRDPDDDAVAAIEELIPQGDEFWVYIRRFSSLIVLSASIAAFGLLADSSAVVIGAMLVAPLMTPITAAAAATVTARNVRLLQSMLIIAFGVFGAIAVGWITSMIARTEVTSVQELPGEILARTFPGLLDLGIAITAGAAAGYISPRRTVISALPGVGIAVALVPPLATVGITAQLGFGTEARNAFLLFLTNLAAIVFAASIMLLFSGFRPESGVGSRSLISRLAVTFVAVGLVAVPLTLHTQDTIEDVSLRRAVTQSVREWDDTVRIVELAADAADGRATVELIVSGPNASQPPWKLAEGIRERFGGPVDLRVLYQRDELSLVSAR